MPKLGAGCIIGQDLCELDEKLLGLCIPDLNELDLSVFLLLWIAGEDSVLYKFFEVHF